MSRRPDRPPPRQRSAESGFSLVELLVVISLISVLGIATMSVVISTQRSSSFQNDMRTVMDDGRIILDRMRQELRQAKRVLDADPDGTWIRFWVDAAQDHQLADVEQICYAVREISGEPDSYEVIRWTNATEDCDTPGADASVIARTLVEPEGVFDPDPPPSDDPLAPRTRTVGISMRLDVRTDAGPETITVETTVRLRNVR